MSFWKPVEDPGTRTRRSWAFDIGCAAIAFAASLAHFSFGQTAHPVSLPVAASLGVAALTTLALPLRRVWPGPVFGWTLLAAAVLAVWPTHGALFPVALAIAPYLPSSAGGALWGQPLVAHPLGPWAGFAVLCGYAAVLTGLAAWRLRRSDA